MSIEKTLKFCKKLIKIKGISRKRWVKRNVGQDFKNQFKKVESVADHSWMVSILTGLFKGVRIKKINKNDWIVNILALICCLCNMYIYRNIYNILIFTFCILIHLNVFCKNIKNLKTYNVERMCIMASLHDITEIVTQDIMLSDDISKEDKEEKEEDAITYLLKDLWGDIKGYKYYKSLIDEYEKKSTPEAKAVKDLDILEFLIQADEYEILSGNNFYDINYNFEVKKIQTQIIREIAEELIKQRIKRIKEN